MDSTKELRRIIKYISAILHESHYPHLHRQLSRDDIIQLNRLRKMFFDKVSINKEAIQKIRDDPTVFICREVVKFLNEGELPERLYEELFRMVETIYSSKQFNNLFNIREDLKKLESTQLLEILDYWKTRDRRFYYSILIVIDFDDTRRTAEHIESMKEIDREFTKMFLLALDKNRLKKIGEMYE
ncbi:MAG: hypothetical protein NZ908_01925 [Candidatus Micrarchaeota archaeon]|nr:hypothetical protein [Candidatus Micrarchaeota archaeon]MCX8154524.1 hypothetical protein [Candidatus Micrarchaeota archaeon]